jgi:hypothetical protein
MKRLLSILLLVLLPIQFGWAVAGVYCEHETGAAGKHFGHHAHQHRVDASTDGTGKAAGQQQAHADCASCHAGFVGVILDPDRICTVSSLLRAVPPAPRVLVSTHLSEPERPDWSTPA